MSLQQIRVLFYTIYLTSIKINQRKYENPTTTERKAQKLVDFIEWAVTDGQQFAEPL